MIWLSPFAAIRSFNRFTSAASIAGNSSANKNVLIPKAAAMAKAVDISTPNTQPFETRS